MSQGHHHYKGAVRVSYETNGVYLLKHPTGTIFPSFEDVIEKFGYLFTFHEGSHYRRWPRHLGFMSNGDYDFDIAGNAVMLRAKNLKKPDTCGRPRLLCDYFYGEIVFRDDCGRKISAYHVLENFSRVRRQIDASRSTHRTWRGIVHFDDYREQDFRKRPVPCTGKRKRYNWDSGRPPVSREIADNASLAFDEDCVEHGIRFRGSRRTRMLEEHLSWDYSMRSDWRIRNWKRHRGHQWKS
ncbi:hypothetical protein G6L37_05735 [Agrobacterium rubi]|nr:hypothetical protein [Agrobacterium rubi]NTF24860.1 hypothetical protein [Agrobacterium rubi]